MSVVFCTTCKNRYQHLAETLPRNLADNTLPDTRFVVLDYNSGDDMAERVATDFWDDLCTGKLAYYKYHGLHSFRMAHAKNMAHRLGMKHGDLLVNLDADNFTGPGFDRYVQKMFAENENAFLWSDMIKGVLPKGVSGRIACTSDAFLLAGGYDEKYETYSPDDKDFNARLRRLGYNPVSIDPSYLNAIRHNDKMRFREYPEAADKGDEDFGIDQHNRVVNYGQFGCGDVTSGFWGTGLTLSPLPTRIFGIGMHKTGTTSLHQAFQDLGYKSAHWKNAPWAKSIWKQMLEGGRSLTVDQNYALCDLPIPNLYRELDLAYPGSKFVLTLRPEAVWLRSVRNHWDANYNPQRARWNKDPFTRIIHRHTYGQVGFDGDLFLRTYRRHNAEVQEYFKNRPGDLYVMDKPGWEGLCGFLGRSVPSIGYPNKNVTPEERSIEYHI